MRNVVRLVFCLSCVGLFCFASPTEILKGRISAGNKRYAGFYEALQLLSDRGARVLVETGTARCGDLKFEEEGGSTILFGDWASQNGARLYSVDNCKAHLRLAKRGAGVYSGNINYLCEDAVIFLKDFPLVIDFLYLDSGDFDISNPEESQKYHLAELMAALPHFSSSTVVMIDDCGLPHGGKGKLVIEYLISHGWRIVMHGYQVILVAR